MSAAPRLDLDQGHRVPADCPQDYALVIRDVTKSFGPVVALRNVELQVRPGEVHALLGENGAGKSTLMAVTAGVIVPDEGTVELAGSLATGLSPDEVRQLGLAVAFQHPALVADLSVAENFLLGLPAARRPGSVRNANAWAGEILAEYGIDLDPATRIADISLADRHLVEIAKAMTAKPSVLLLDEPTEPLSAQQSEALFDRIRGVAQQGTAVVYISHRLQDVRRISDRVTILRDGRNQGTFATAELTEDDILRLIVGRPVSAAFPDKPETVRGPERLVVRGLSASGFSHVDLTVRGGEIVGLAGIDGNGQREFIRALAGVHHSSGDLEIDGVPLDDRKPRSARRLGAVYIPGDRHAEGLLPELSVRENVTLLSLPKYASAGWIKERREQEAASEQRERLGIKMRGSEAPVSSLSGGNQQKVLFARALLADPTVLLADEPTQGVDAGARVDIYAELRRTADEGAAVVLHSSEAVELRGLCDRVLVFSRGQVVRELHGDEVTEDNITYAAVTADTLREQSDSALSRPGWLRRLARGDHAPAILLAFIAVGVGAYTATQNDRYLSEVNFESYLYLAAILGLVALAQAIVVMTGGIDLSVGPTIAFVTVLGASVLTSQSVVPIILAMGLLLAAAAGVGVANGLLVEVARITPVIATLVTFFALQGVNLLIRSTAGGRVSGRVPELTKASLGFVPVAFIVAVGTVLVFEFALRQTLWGLRLRAVGSSRQTALQLGVNTGRTVIWAYVACSLVTGLAAIFFTGLIQVGDPRGGINYTLSGIAVVVLGGAAVSGGRGSFIGALAGAVVLQQTVNVSTFLRLNSEWQFWFLGILTLGAASLYSRARQT